MQPWQLKTAYQLCIFELSHYYIIFPRYIGTIINFDLYIFCIQNNSNILFFFFFKTRIQFLIRIAFRGEFS